LRRRPRLEALEDRAVPTAGALDHTFGGAGVPLVRPPLGGSASGAGAVAALPDGHILVAGNLRGGQTDMFLARLNADSRPAAVDQK
jgi:Domain of unknown function (DUF5122) beta-propeller